MGATLKQVNVGRPAIPGHRAVNELHRRLLVLPAGLALVGGVALPRVLLHGAGVLETDTTLNLRLATTFCWRKRYKYDIFCIYDALYPVSLSAKERTCNPGVYGGDLKLVPSAEDVFLGMHEKPNCVATEVTCQPNLERRGKQDDFGVPEEERPSRNGEPAGAMCGGRTGAGKGRQITEERSCGFGFSLEFGETVVNPENPPASNCD